MLRKMKINKYFLGIVLIIIIIMYFMAGVLFLGNTREDNNMKVSTEQQEIAYQTFKSETEGYSLHQNMQKICRIILWTKKLLIYNSRRQRNFYRIILKE